jgi:uncharacterized membrane protein YkoI
MRKLFFIAVLSLATLVGAEAAIAQVRIPNYSPNLIAKRGQAIRKVPAIVIPPSMALNRAMMVLPGAKAIGVRLRGPLYIVKLKQGNRIMQVRVNAKTGSIAP